MVHAHPSVEPYQESVIAGINVSLLVTADNRCSAAPEPRVASAGVTPMFLLH